MRLEIGGDRPPADPLGAGEADALEFGAEGDAGDIVRPCQTLGEIEGVVGEKREHSSLVQVTVPVPSYRCPMRVYRIRIKSPLSGPYRASARDSGTKVGAAAAQGDDAVKVP